MLKIKQKDLACRGRKTSQRRLGAGMKRESRVTTVYSKRGGGWNRMGV